MACVMALKKKVGALRPEQYNGELLCPCCGITEDGRFFQDCTHPLVTHFESCERYEYAIDLCPRCTDG